jgi:hypothetical protein
MSISKTIAIVEFEFTKLLSRMFYSSAYNFYTYYLALEIVFLHPTDSSDILDLATLFLNLTDHISSANNTSLIKQLRRNDRRLQL